MAIMQRLNLWYLNNALITSYFVFISCSPRWLWMSQVTFYAAKLHFQMCSSTCTCAFSSSSSSFISVFNSTSSGWSSFHMNQLIIFITNSQHV